MGAGCRHPQSDSRGQSGEVVRVLRAEGRERITMTRTAALTLFVLVFSRGLAIETMAAGANCESLAGRSLANGTVTSAATVPAGAFVPPGAAGRGPAAQQYAALPSFCRVQATLNPSSDSDIKVEIWLPVSGWNGKFQAVGNGGWAGTISYSALAAAV